MSKVANDAGFKRKAGIIAATIGASVDTAKSLPFKPFSHDAKELPVLIAEGTGMFEPYGIERDPIEGPRNFVNKRMPSTSAGRKLIVRKPGKGNAFFVGSMLVFTSYWYKLGERDFRVSLNFFFMTSSFLPQRLQCGRRLARLFWCCGPSECSNRSRDWRWKGPRG